MKVKELIQYLQSFENQEQEVEIANGEGYCLPIKVIGEAEAENLGRLIVISCYTDNATGEATYN